MLMLFGSWFRYFSNLGKKANIEKYLTTGSCITLSYKSLFFAFNGINGKYRLSLIEEILPVRCLKGDDRKNLASGAVFVEKKLSHPILKGIPLMPSPVVIGYNQVRAKKNAKVVLKLRENVSGIKNPLLTLGSYGKGKTAAFTTDVAPHWCGGLVDWGNQRLRINVDRNIKIEVGNFYVKFFSQLVKWLR